MNSETHERAKKLLRVARVEGIRAEERRWLDAHLVGCLECSNEANALVLAIDSLRSLSVSVSPEAVRRTSLALYRRSEQLRYKRERALPLWVAVAMSGVLAIVTTPYTWSTFAWLGRLLHVSDTVWQLGFVVWWFEPATVLSAVAGGLYFERRRHASHSATE